MSLVIKHYAIGPDNIRNNEANYTYYVQNEWTKFDCEKFIRKFYLKKESTIPKFIKETCKSSPFAYNLLTGIF
jgi:hypothetical protein